METVTMNTEEMIEVGVTSMRRPDRSFLPSVPLFVRASDYETLLDQRKTERGETAHEASNHVAKMFASHYHQYLESQRIMEEKAAEQKAKKLLEKQEKAKEATI